jgi:hypothetical protein
LLYAFTTKSSAAIETSPALEALSFKSTVPELYSPEAGASGVSLEPIFQWSVLAKADSYELLVSTNASFTNPLIIIIIKISAYALSSTAWQSDINLDYDTTYYWKVRASDSGGYSTWSAIIAFTIEPPELTLPSSSESSSPPPSPELTIPD